MTTNKLGRLLFIGCMIYITTTSLPLALLLAASIIAMGGGDDNNLENRP